MRDLAEYPITTEEILYKLKELREREQERIEDTQVIGDLTAMIIEEAIARVLMAQTFSVSRMDDHGNTFSVRKGLSYQDAMRLHEMLVERGHKQTYKIEME